MSQKEENVCTGIAKTQSSLQQHKGYSLVEQLTPNIGIQYFDNDEVLLCP